MKKVLFFAVAAIALAACSKTYEVTPSAQKAIDFGSWAESLTKAPKTEFAENDVFDVFGYKWKGTEDSQTEKTTVFDGIDVKKTSAGWVYAGVNSQTIRYWDPSFAGYTFFAAYPPEVVSTSTSPAQDGLFTASDITYDGTDEKLLVAGKKTVLNASFGSTVDLMFYHTAAKVDFKFKKHADLASSEVSVTAFSLANIRTKGSYAVASYDAANNNKPVGATVNSIAGLGWTPDATPTVNSAAAPYVMASAATSVANATAAVALLSDLIVMPQEFATGTGAQTFSIAYTITDEAGQENTYTPDPIEIRLFDNTDVDNDTVNNATVGKWLPGVHYTYTITINANSIVFSADISSWSTLTENGHYYLIN